MQKLIVLKVSNLKIDDLSGLCTETVTYALGHGVGELANARLVTLDAALTAMRARMDINRKSPPHRAD